MRSMRGLLSLYLGAAAVVACSRGAANDKGDTASTAAADLSSSAPANSDSAVAPPKVTTFAHGDASLTYGTPMKLKLSHGKLVASPQEEFGEVESIFLGYTPDGQTATPGGLEFNAGRNKTGGYHIDDMRITSHGFWRINAEAHCTIAVSEVGPSGVRGTITCPGDPKGPTGPITFTANP